MATERILEDICGVTPLEVDDPRWLEILKFDTLVGLFSLSDSAPEWLLQWSGNNKVTENYQRLIEQLLYRLNLLQKQKGPKTLQTVQECCTALHLLTITLQILSSHTSKDEVARFLCLKSPPDRAFHSPLSNQDSQTAFDRLMNETTSVIGVIDDQLIDVKLFCVNLWIVLLQAADFYDFDYFHLALHSFASTELQRALQSPHDRSAFSSCTAVRMVRGLLYGSLNLKEDHLQYSSYGNNGKTRQAEYNRSLVWSVLVEKLGPTERNVLIQGSRGGPLLSSSVLMGTVQTIFFEFVKRIPVKGLQDFLTSSAVRYLQLTPPENTTSSASTTASTTATMKLNMSAATKARNLYLTQSLMPERFAQLLLLLLHQRRNSTSSGSNVPIFNPFRQAFSFLADLELDTENTEEQADIEMLNMHGSSASSTLMMNYVHVDFSLILNTLSESLPRPTSVLLLYSFLQMHPTFLDILRHLEVTKTIVLQLLKGIYQLCVVSAPKKATDAAASTTSTHGYASASSDKTSNTAPADPYEHLNDLYTLSVCLLMVVQDAVLFPRLASCLVAMPWYKERTSSTMKLLDGVVVVTLRAFSFALFRVQDSYLLANLCAVLMNVVPCCQDLHPYASERIVRTIFTYCRRLVHAQQQQMLLQQEQIHLPSYSSADLSTGIPPSLQTPVHASKQEPQQRFVQRGQHKWLVAQDDLDSSGLSPAAPHHTLPTSASNNGNSSQNTSHYVPQINLLSAASMDTSIHTMTHVPQPQPHQQIHVQTKRRGSNASLADLQATPVDLDLVKAALLALIQFTGAVTKARLAENMYFLYALILDHSSLLRYFPSNDSTEDSESTASTNAHSQHGVDAQLLQSCEVSHEWRTAYADMQAVTALADFYLRQIDSACGAHGERFFSAKEASTYLRRELLRFHNQATALPHPSRHHSHQNDQHTSGADDLEGGGSSSISTTSTTISTGTSLSSSSTNATIPTAAEQASYRALLQRLRRGHDPHSSSGQSMTAMTGTNSYSSSYMDDHFRAQYMYQEAENAADFFVPYISSAIVSFAPTLQR